MRLIFIYFIHIHRCLYTVVHIYSLQVLYILEISVDIITLIDVIFIGGVIFMCVLFKHLWSDVT